MKGSRVNYKTNLEFGSYNLKSRVLSCLEDYIKSYAYKQVVELDTLQKEDSSKLMDEMMSLRENFVEIN